MSYDHRAAVELGARTIAPLLTYTATADVTDYFVIAMKRGAKFEMATSVEDPATRARMLKRVAEGLEAHNNGSEED